MSLGAATPAPQPNEYKEYGIPMPNGSTQDLLNIYELV